MCNFNKLDEDTKAFLHIFMTKAAQTLGGANFLLALVEAIRATKPHPLTTSKCEIKSPHATLKWNKIIFKDKLMVIEEILLAHKTQEGVSYNILDQKSQKMKKRVINMLKTLAPIKFTVTAKNEAQEGDFEFEIFEKIDLEGNYAKLNPAFVSLCFCSVEFTKKALKHEV
jgi:hypothetical protein